MLCSGPPSRHHIRLGEQLEIAGHRQNADEQQYRREARQRHVAELLPARRAVDACRFVQVFGNALQRREQDDHVVTEVLPDGDDDDRRHGPVRIAQPVDRTDADKPQRVIQKPVARVEDVAPDDGDGDQRRDDGREVDRAKHVA